MLMEFNNMGDLMRSAMTKALINPQVRTSRILKPFNRLQYEGLGAYWKQDRGNIWMGDHSLIYREPSLPRRVR